jgi:hypothetical protein
MLSPSASRARRRQAEIMGCADRTLRQQFPNWCRLREMHACAMLSIEMLSSTCCDDHADCRHSRAAYTVYIATATGSTTGSTTSVAMSRVLLSEIQRKLLPWIFSPIHDARLDFSKPPCPASCYEQDECGGGAGVEQPRSRNAW